MRKSRLHTLPVGYSEDHLSLAIQELGEKLIESLTVRGYPVEHSELSHRVFYNGAMFGGRYVLEVWIEYDRLTESHAALLTHAYRVGQMDGRTYEQLMSNSDPSMSREEWVTLMKQSDKSPWSSTVFLPADMTRAEMKTLDLAWRRGWLNGRHAEQGSGDLSPSPYSKDEE